MFCVVNDAFIFVFVNKFFDIINMNVIDIMTSSFDTFDVFSNTFSFLFDFDFLSKQFTIMSFDVVMTFKKQLFCVKRFLKLFLFKSFFISIKFKFINVFDCV